ncbi:hypothetical protein N7474_005717 [Penicillium riverlandense]|uniref:uncharacterized protein n=1 Tax=Penicillium riverlandense TaxID=1903569 RepID=UPI0025469DBE|nr:uncharacterized protein N7474_005717 [Penicillium riverlandense]KAJ5820126.1 hypothetical protein N7474_005717 [Penicillium riverlandense]
MHDYSYSPSSAGVALVVICTVLTAIATTFVVARLIARFVISKTSGIDDWCIVAAVIFAIGTHVTISIGVGNGTGTRAKVKGPDTIFLGHIRLATQVLYAAASGTLKLSILFLYLRLFRNLRKLIIITIVIVSCMTIAFIFTAIFQCDPVGSFWTMTDDAKASCIPELIFWCDVAVIFLLTNLWIGLLPIKTILTLHVTWTKRVKVLGLLCSAAFITCVAAAVRLAFVIHLYKGNDPSWDSVPIYYCSEVELTTALIAASIPAIRLAWPKAREYFSFWRGKVKLSGESEQSTVSV